MNATRRRELKAWGKAAGLTAVVLATLAVLALAGVYSTTL